MNTWAETAQASHFYFSNQQSACYHPQRCVLESPGSTEQVLCGCDPKRHNGSHGKGNSSLQIRLPTLEKGKINISKGFPKWKYLPNKKRYRSWRWGRNLNGCRLQAKRAIRGAEYDPNRAAGHAWSTNRRYARSGSRPIKKMKEKVKTNVPEAIIKKYELLLCGVGWKEAFRAIWM